MLMDNNFELLTTLVSGGGNCVNLGRSMHATNRLLHEWVVESSSFLNTKPKVTFNERVYCILNDINDITMNGFEKPAVFENLFKGYSHCDASHHRHVVYQEKLRLKEQRKKTRSPPKTPLEYFVSRNRKRNAHLYNNDLIEGQDYIICPVSNERVLAIRKDYITNVLCMSVNDYDRLYPGVRGKSPAYIGTIKAGLKKIDEETGLTKHRLAMAKTRKTLSRIDENTGLSGYDLKGQKTRETHLANVDEFGRNGYERLAHYRKTTVLNSGRTIEEEAHTKQVKTIMATRGKLFPNYGSDQSLVLNELVRILECEGYNYYYQDSEYVIFDTSENKHYFYDLVCPDLKLVVEFHGTGWHVNPFTCTDQMWNTAYNPVKTKSLKEQHEYDYVKARAIYRERGYLVFFVYHDTAPNDISVVKEYINDCI